MVNLYNCKHSGDQYRITKFTSDFEVEASYLCDLSSCECPAGHRPKCRHREMLPKFIQRNHVGDEWFLDFDRGGWVQGWKEEPTVLETDKALQMPNDIGDEYLREIMSREEFQPEDVSLASAALPIQQEVEPSLTIAHEITLPADATGDQVAEAFANLIQETTDRLSGLMDSRNELNKSIAETDAFGLAPAGLGQASEQTPSPIYPLPPNFIPTFIPPSLYEAMVIEGKSDMRFYKKQELIPMPSPSPTIRRRV